MSVRSLRSSATRGVLWSAAQTLGHRLLTVATFVILARLLEPKAFGLVAFASVAIGFLTIFVQQGLRPALVQAPELEKRHLDTAFWMSLAFAILLTLLVVVTAPLIATLFRMPAAADILRALSPAFVLSALATTHAAILQRRMAFKILALRQTVGNLAGGGIGVALALTGAGVWALVAQVLTTLAVGTVLVWVGSRWRPGTAVTVSTYVELHKFSRNVVGAQLAAFFLRRTDDLFIGAVLGPVALGIYSVSYRLLLVMLDVSINTVAQVALPTFARMQQDKARLRRAYSAASRASAVIALPTFCFVIAAAPEVIVVAFGTKWMPSIEPMRILALIGIANTISNFNGTVLTAIGKPQLTFRYVSVSAVANAVLIALAVPHGLLAVAGAVVVGQAFVASPISIRMITIELEMTYRQYFGDYVTPMVASVFMAATVAGVHVALVDDVGAAARLAIMVLVAMAVYAVALFVLDRPLLRELKALLGAVASRGRGGPVDGDDVAPDHLAPARRGGD